MKIKFKIVTPERIVYEDEIDQITLPTKVGEITILPNHIPLVSSLRPGEVLIKKDKHEVPMAISGGFAEFNDNQLIILADTAERVEEIDEKRADEARQRVKELLEKRQEQENIDFTALATKLEKELARLKVAKKYKHIRTTPQIKIEKDEEIK